MTCDPPSEWTVCGELSDDAIATIARLLLDAIDDDLDADAESDDAA